LVFACGGAAGRATGRRARWVRARTEPRPLQCSMEIKVLRKTGLLPNQTTIHLLAIVFEYSTARSVSRFTPGSPLIRARSRLGFLHDDSSTCFCTFCDHCPQCIRGFKPFNFRAGTTHGRREKLDVLATPNFAHLGPVILFGYVDGGWLDKAGNLVPSAKISRRRSVPPAS